MGTSWQARDGRTFNSEREAIFHNTVIEGHRLVDRGEYDEGIDILTAAIDYPADAIRTHTERMCCYAKRGEAYSAKKLYDMAISDYTTAIESYNSATRTKYGFDDERIAGRYVNRAKAYSAKGNYDNAIADFTEAIKLGYYQDLAYNDRGVAYSKKGNAEQAIADYKAAANWGFHKSSSIEATALGNLKNKGINHTPVTPPEVIQARIDAENERIWREKQAKKQRIIDFFSPFSIVDSDSGEGSTTIIGGLIAIIAGAIAWKIGGWIPAGIAAIAGGVFGGKFLGEIIHVKLLKVIIYIVILSALATGGMYLYAMIDSGIGKPAVTRTEQTTEEKTAALANLAGNFLTVYSETINIYSGASNTSRKIKTMYKGNTITATGNVAGVWVPVESGNDKGFVFVPSVKHASFALIEYPYDAATASSVQLVNQMTNAQGLSIPRGTVVTVTGTFDNSNMSIEYKNGSYKIDNALAEALLPMLNEDGSLIPEPERPAAFNRKLPFKATVTEEIRARNFNNSNLFSIPAKAEVSIVHRYNSSVRVKYNNQEAIVQWKYLTVE